jgi:hypothetical protein
MRSTLGFFLGVLSALTVGCGTDGPVPGDIDSTVRPTIEIQIAPLTLTGIDFACYDVLVTNGPGGTGDTVWSEGDPLFTKSGADQTAPPPGTFNGANVDTTTICSDRFGNAGGGGISYVGPCDADDPSGSRVNTVTIWIDGLYGGANLDLGEWQDPCPDGCSIEVLCSENQDTKAEFNLTVMRDADQGFFDIAVSFEDVFCSAKLDTCYEGDEHIDLLHGTDGERGWTAVFGLACTGGVGSAVDTTMLYSNLEVVCGGTTFPLPTARPNGNQSVEVDGHTLNYGIYCGAEDLACDDAETAEIESCNKAYWNLAISLDDLSAVGEPCTLAFNASATDGSQALTNGLPTATGASYPYIDVNATLTPAACQQNPLNGEGSAVTTVYRGDLGGLTPPLTMCSQCDGTAVTSVDGVSPELCRQCEDQYCLACAGAGIGACTECEEGLVLENGECVCPPDLVGPVDGICIEVLTDFAASATLLGEPACSAELNCLDAAPDGSNNILFNGDTRATTAVLSFGCSGADNLYMSDVYIECDHYDNNQIDPLTDPLGSDNRIGPVATLRPSAGPGTMSGPTPGIFSYAALTGRKDFGGAAGDEVFSTLALGIEDSFFDTPDLTDGDAKRHCKVVAWMTGGTDPKWRSVQSPGHEATSYVRVMADLNAPAPTGGEAGATLDCGQQTLGAPDSAVEVLIDPAEFDTPSGDESPVVTFKNIIDANWQDTSLDVEATHYNQHQRSLNGDWSQPLLEPWQHWFLHEDFATLTDPASWINSTGDSVVTDGRVQDWEAFNLSFDGSEYSLSYNLGPADWGAAPQSFTITACRGNAVRISSGGYRGDGACDPLDPPVEGLGFRMVNSHEIPGGQVAPAFDTASRLFFDGVTDANGVLTFDDVPPGNYFIMPVVNDMLQYVNGGNYGENWTISPYDFEQFEICDYGAPGSGMSQGGSTVERSYLGAASANNVSSMYQTWTTNHTAGIYDDELNRTTIDYSNTNDESVSGVYIYETVNLREGGPSGDIIATENIFFPDTGGAPSQLGIYWNKVFPAATLTSGQDYTIEIVNASGAISWLSHDTDVDASGSSNLGATDLGLEVVFGVRKSHYDYPADWPHMLVVGGVEQVSSVDFEAGCATWVRLNVDNLSETYAGTHTLVVRGPDDAFGYCNSIGLFGPNHVGSLDHILRNRGGGTGLCDWDGGDERLPGGDYELTLEVWENDGATGLPLTLIDSMVSTFTMPYGQGVNHVVDATALNDGL